MVRSELVARIAEQNPRLYAREVEAVVDTILDRIATALASDDRVELRDFGAFTTKELQERAGRNPKTGKTVIVAAKRNIHFKPSKAMRARLNRDDGQPQGKAQRVRRAS